MLQLLSKRLSGRVSCRLHNRINCIMGAAGYIFQLIDVPFELYDILIIMDTSLWLDTD